MMSPRGPTLPPQRQIWTQRIHSHLTAEQQTDTSDTMGGGLCYLGTFVLTDGPRNPRPDENGFRNFNSTNATWWALFMNIYFDPSFLYFTRSSLGPSLQFQMTLFELRLSFTDCTHFSTGRFFTLLAVNFCNSACRKSQILRFMQKLSLTFFSATWSRSCIIRSHQGFRVRAGTNTRKFGIVFCGNPRLEVVVNKQASQIYSVLYHDILLTISQQNIW